MRFRFIKNYRFENSNAYIIICNIENNSMKDKRGRPTESIIRNNIAELLFFLGEAYGYDLYKKYKRVFEQKISLRSIYYHLNKGVETNEFAIKEVQNIKGNYSWGEGVRRVIFKLGANARPGRSEEVKEKLYDIL